MSPRDSFQGISPVLLSSSCDVLPVNSAIPDIGQLSYPFRKAIVIEEIRWTLRAAANIFGANLGAVVSTKMMLGQHYLMRDPVPIWLLGTTMASLQEESQTDPAFSHYRWRLPEPLYVEAGQVLHPWFTRGNDDFGPINVQVSFVGRTVAPNQPRPKLLAVPYAASWVTKVGNVYQQSNEFDLFNPFTIPLRVQRLTGRVVRIDGNLTAQAVKSMTPDTPGAAITLLINDSWGGKMVNNNTGPGDIFDLARSAWTVDTVMPPKGVYEVRAWNIVNPLRVHIGMIGVREEAL